MNSRQISVFNYLLEQNNYVTAKTISKEWSVYVRKQKILLHEAQGKFLLQ